MTSHYQLHLFKLLQLHMSEFAPSRMIKKRKSLFLLCLSFLVILILYFLLIPLTANLPSVQRAKQLETENKHLHTQLSLFQKQLNLRHVSTSLQEEPFPRDVSKGNFATETVESVSNNPDMKCEVIHIAMVAAGHGAARSVVTLMKSILFYRHNPIHLHFISDDTGQYILSTIFETWRLPLVHVYFYPISIALDMVSWIPNSHYSGVYGLMKLTLPMLLPPSLQKVIVLDTDLMFTDNILTLWAYFRAMERAGKLLGLVENQSNWYLGNLWDKHIPWPALGRGFNTGVVLFNLQLMRERGWNRLWTDVATRALFEHESTALADQDIINTLIKECPDLHYVLPCFWNAQLSDHSLSDYCYRNADQFKVVHWNSPLKLQVTNEYGRYFRNKYRMFESHDGELFREVLLTCDKPSTEINESSHTDMEDPCLDFRREKHSVYRTHPYLVDFSYPVPSDHDITLVTQMSMDRLHMLEPLCKHWDGPLSIVLYASDSEVQAFLDYYFSSPLRDNTRLGLHMVYKSASKFYPINYLRNVALSNVNTPNVFLSDIDFLPMEGAYQYLLEAVRALGGPRRALIVPAFDTLIYKFTFPNNKEELLEMLRNGDVSTFRSRVWSRGHAPTNYEHWKETRAPYRVKWAPDFEPYVIVSRNVSKYDQRFAGFGWNKVSHIMELEAQRYEFVVLPSLFMIHMPHSPSLDIATFRQSKAYRDCVQVLKTEFKFELENRYNQLDQD